MPRKLSMVVGAALILLIGLSGVANAQGTVTGSVQGTVKDAEGGVMPGVLVTAISNALVKGRMTTTTDVRGSWRFPALPPGNYSIEAELPGFKKVRRDGIRVSLGQALAVDLVLPLASVTAEAVVTAESPIVSVVENKVSTSFGGDFINKQAVPRNYYQVLASAPGVNIDSSASASSSSMLAYGGTSESQNAFTLDGVNVASLALMAVVTAHLAGAAIVDVPTALLGALALLLLVRFRMNATWLVVGGALLGAIMSP